MVNGTVSLHALPLLSFPAWVITMIVACGSSASSTLQSHFISPTSLIRSCPSIFKRKKKTGSQERGTVKKQQEQQNGRKAPDMTEHTYERVLKVPVSQKRTQNRQSEESNLHYADIQVYSHRQPRSARGVKTPKSENTTEYATLRFPEARPHHNSKKGTLV